MEEKMVRYFLVSILFITSCLEKGNTDKTNYYFDVKKNVIVDTTRLPISDTAFIYYTIDEYRVYFVSFFRLLNEPIYTENYCSKNKINQSYRLHMSQKWGSKVLIRVDQYKLGEIFVYYSIYKDITNNLLDIDTPIENKVTIIKQDSFSVKFSDWKKFNNIMNQAKIWYLPMIIKTDYQGVAFTIEAVNERAYKHFSSFNYFLYDSINIVKPFFDIAGLKIPELPKTD